METTFNVRVEYECTPIKHIAVQCPKCGKWFRGWDIVKARNPHIALRHKHDINWAEFECPVCGMEFGGLHNHNRPNTDECWTSKRVYEGCLERKETWA